MHVLFEGKRFKIIDANSREVSELMSQGIVKQENGILMDKEGRIIIITQKGIYAHSQDNPFPYLLGKAFKKNYKVYIEGSVARADKIVYTNYHVMRKARTLVYDGEETKVIPIKAYAPTLMGKLTFALLKAFNKVFHINVIPISKYDFAIGLSKKQISNYNPDADLIYFAGTCTNLIEDGCFGFALPIPTHDKYPNPESMIGSSFIMNCTAYGIVTDGSIVDYGKVVVNYGGKFALFDDAFMLKFVGANGIPGCSGSAVTIKPVRIHETNLENSDCGSSGYNTVVNSTITIKPLR